jgi:hypothetical protein
VIRVQFRPLLVSGMIASANGGLDFFILVDDEQSEQQQSSALIHELLHLVGLTDESQVEALAQRMADACPELASIVRRQQ